MQEIPCRPFHWSTLLALLPGPLTFCPLQTLCCWHVKSKKEWPGIRTYFRALLCIWWTCRAQWSFPPASQSLDEQQQGWCCHQFWKWEGTRSQRQAISQWHTIWFRSLSIHNMYMYVHPMMWCLPRICSAWLPLFNLDTIPVGQLQGKRE